MSKVCTNKNCPHNGEPQPLDNFHKKTRNADGLESQCKTCRKDAMREQTRRKAKELNGFYDLIFGGGNG